MADHADQCLNFRDRIQLPGDGIDHNVVELSGPVATDAAAPEEAALEVYQLGHDWYQRCSTKTPADGSVVTAARIKQGSIGKETRQTVHLIVSETRIHCNLSHDIRILV